MTVTTDWDETLPADVRNPALGDDDIRDLKKQIRERERKGGHFHEDGSSGPTTDVDAGKHVCGEESLGDGGGNDGLFIIFESDVHASDRDTAAVTLGDGSAAGADTDAMTLGDGVDGSRPYTMIADVLEGKRIHDVAIPLPASGTGRINGLYWFNQTAFTLVIESIDLYANTGPNAGALTVDIHRHTTGWTDLDSGGTTILTTPASDLSIADASGSPARLSSPLTSFAIENIATGEVLAFEIDELNDADDMILFIRFRRTN